MKLAIKVVDGFHGLPAAGIGVRITRPASGDGSTSGIRGTTNENGEFTYRTKDHPSADSEAFRIELDVDAYFSALGIVSFYKEVGASCRVLDSTDDYQVIAVITPFMQATLSAH